MGESDFSKGLLEMTSTEENAQGTYDQETKDNEIEKTTKEQDIKYKSEEGAGLEKATAEAKSDKSGVQEELDAVNEYLKTIEERCIAKAEPYEERVRRREAEQKGLQFWRKRRQSHFCNVPLGGFCVVLNNKS